MSANRYSVNTRQKVKINDFVISIVVSSDCQFVDNDARSYVLTALY